MFRAALVGALLLTACSGPAPPPPRSGGSTSPAPTSTTPSDPVIAAAGDIACDPDTPAFNAGSGTRAACRQRYTGDLLAGGGYTAVLVLGDIQYEIASRDDFRRSYDPSW